MQKANNASRFDRQWPSQSPHNLLTIPPEIRKTIYRLVLLPASGKVEPIREQFEEEQERSMEHRKRLDWMIKVFGDTFPHLIEKWKFQIDKYDGITKLKMDLPCTCKQIHAEALHELYSQVRLTFNADTDFLYGGTPIPKEEGRPEAE